MSNIHFLLEWYKNLLPMLLTSTTNLPAGVMVARNGFGLIVYAAQALVCVEHAVSNESDD